MNNVERLKIMLALLLIIIIFSSFIMTLVIFRISLESERDIEKKIKNRRNKMTDKEVYEYPAIALMRYFDKLTEDQFDYCVHKCPSTAFRYFVDKLTEDQFDYCVHKCPSTASRYFADKLTAEQKKFCKENAK